ncbi:MAG: hypothetical protein KAS46_06160, partial [Candidatus Aureabacteria bacterium]|nr:hypothetical protein [Candidatus Auribacterota bacterium]
MLKELRKWLITEEAEVLSKDCAKLVEVLRKIGVCPSLGLTCFLGYIFVTFVACGPLGPSSTSNS